MHRTKRDGQALVEAMIAISVLTVGFLGIVTLLSRSLSLNRTVADQYLGSYLAAEGIEIVRNLLDAGIIQEKSWWKSGVIEGKDYAVDYTTSFQDGGFLPLSTGAPLQYNAATNLYGYDIGGKNTIFRRVIRVEKIGSDEMRVNAVVSWQMRGGGTGEVDVEDHFYNWRP
ncbi:MAG: hypothetical protein AAB867_01250 [Patescibacteria group bacterium]